MTPNLPDVQVPQLVDLLASFIVVRRANVNDFMLQRFVKHLRAGEQPDHWDLFLLRHGYINFRGGCAHKESQCEHAFFRHALEACGSFVGIVAVIKACS